jgi:multicomponent Na+:H+ antiporter subunit G
MTTLLLVAGDLLVVAGLVTLTLALVGTWRFPDLFSRLHATSKIGSLGLSLLLLGTVATADLAIVARAALIALFLFLTTPVSTHAIARAAHRRRLERQRSRRASEPSEPSEPS